jgi:hypothetical protein
MAKISGAAPSAFRCVRWLVLFAFCPAAKQLLRIRTPDGGYPLVGQRFAYTRASLATVVWETLNSRAICRQLSPLLSRRKASCCCSGFSFGLRPTRPPRATAARLCSHV